MSHRRDSQAMRSSLDLTLVLSVVLLQLLAAQVDAQRSNTTSLWKTLGGDRPLVIARGGFSGLFQDSSYAAYSLALSTSVPDVVLWCDVQLTKDGVGICFPDVKLDNATDIADVFRKGHNSYRVNGVPSSGWFALDFNLKDLGNVSLTQGIYARSNKFDGNGYQIMTVEDVATQTNLQGFWLNIQHDAFYAQHNLSMRNFVLSVSRSAVVNYISSPEVSFLRGITGRFRPSVTKLVFRFLGQDDIEPSTNQTYRSLLNNLTFIKSFASGILVPKSYIFPVDTNMYLLRHTSLVQDAHKQGLEVYAADFANDFTFAYNYSYDPVAEYLSFVDNGEFSVDGVLTDFPITPSEAFGCFSHLGRMAREQVDLLVISKNGASGDYPGCSDFAYQKAVADGADIIDCPVQISRDGIPFCLSSINLEESTTVSQSPFNHLSSTIPEIKAGSGIYSFSLTWSQIQNLTLAISNPFPSYNLLRNPKNKNAGRLLSLSDFLGLAKNSSSLSGILINVENAAYLAEKQGLGVIDAVLDALTKAGYNNLTTTKVMIMSTNSSVLMEFKEKSNYEFVYKIEEDIRDILDSAVEDIKKFADSVVINKRSIFPDSEGFITGQTKVVPKLQKFKLPVYVGTFSNEFVSQAYDFYSDSTVEINNYIQGAGINGVITDFPKTSARYERTRCFGGKEIPVYMNLVQPGSLLGIVTPQLLPPAEAPNPVYTDSDVTEPPLPSATTRAPSSSTGPTASGPPSPSGQTRVVSCISLSILVMCLSNLLILLVY